MVILETAAIGAAGYGLYRGGDAAVRKGKETHKEMQRERVRQSQRSELTSKSKTRQERIAQLVQLRQAPPATVARASSTASTTALSSSSSLPLSDPWDNYNNDNKTNNNDNNNINQKELDDRHRAVMAKLSQGRSQQQSTSVKKAGPGEKLKSLFGGGSKRK